ncbi:MAG: hypothetical protein M3Q94_05400, partial [Pseudomonadota bacterium]|nr:hypothetical protein [Pseudomonadota bacterium]
QQNHVRTPQADFCAGLGHRAKKKRREKHTAKFSAKNLKPSSTKITNNFQRLNRKKFCTELWSGPAVPMPSSLLAPKSCLLWARLASS